MPEVVKITVDGVEHDARAGEMLIKSAQDQGTYIPRFCWHERMEPVGMCRMCLVEIDTPRGPMLVTAKLPSGDASTNWLPPGTLNRVVRRPRDRS